jgi:hypothetical protein
MSRRTLIGVIAGLGLLTGLGTAFAQDYQQNYAPEPPPMGWNRMRPPPQPQEMDPDLTGGQLLPPRAIIGSLARRGYRDVQIKRVRGDSYIVQASDPQGGRVLIVVDGRTTEITGLRQIGMDRPQRRWDDDGWLPPRPWGGPRW